MQSSKALCRRTPTAASCLARPYSPPPRTVAWAGNPASRSQAALAAEKRGSTEMLKPS
ncbi:hypothetical protein STENM327S_04475 [Streptomyces tendae]